MNRDKFEENFTNQLIKIEKFLKDVKNDKSKFLDVTEEDRKPLVEYLVDINISIENIEDLING